jgi:hypothetical protein
MWGNLNKSKIVVRVLKYWGKLNNPKRGTFYDKNECVTDKFNYLSYNFRKLSYQRPLSITYDIL